MAQIRQSYPGWIILPENYYHEFEDVSIKFPFLGHDISILKENKSQLISFLFELDWRLNISLSPKDVDWYIKSLSELIDEYVPENQSEKNKLESLWVSLLSIYRKQLDFNNFKKLQEKLNSLKNQFSNENIRRFYYECLLYNLSILDYEAVKKQLCEWRVLKSDYHGILCKANVYAEIGLENDAVSILNESLQNIRTQLLVNNISPLLTSCRILIEGNIRIYDYKRLGIIHKRKDQLSYDFFTIIRGLKRKIQDYTQSDSIYKKHEFNIGKTTRIWNLGPSGYDKSYLYSYRYIQAYEYVGFPIGLTDLTINNIDFRYVIPYYLKYNVYALLILIRLNNTNIVKKCVSRAVLKGISVEQACAFFDIYYPNILKYLNNKVSSQKKAND